MKTREEIIKPLIRNKHVLDLGNSWGDFKDLIQKEAKSYKGLDLEKGADYQHDLNTPLKLNKKFDVIVAGELIEHLENVGIFLKNIKDHLNPKGILFLTTPNPTSFRFFTYLLMNKEPEFEGHTIYFTKDALSLVLSRYLKIKKIGFTHITTNSKGSDKLLWKIKFHIECIIGTIIPRLSPHLYAICELK